MRVACPNCTAEYDVPDALLAGGPRRLRCARCGHMFEAGAASAVTPALPPAPASAPPLPSPPPSSLPPVPEPRHDNRAAPPPAPQEAAPETIRPPPQSLFDPDRPPPTRGLRRHSPIDTPPELPEAEKEVPRGRALVALAWLLSFAVLGAAGWAAVAYRAEITEAWPPAARLYGALGLE